MVSSRLVDWPDDAMEEAEGDVSELQPNPDMMFALGEEPVGVRILTYQSSTALKRIFNALDEEEVEMVRQSAFGKFLEIADKPGFSGRFVRYMLSRQLKTKKKHEIWFRFAGKPVRFSLREFAIVTGLPCGKYPKKSKLKLKATISEQPYWPCLFGKVDSVSVSAVIKMLYRKTVKDREIRLKYAYLALLESVLLPTSLNMKISRDHVEAIKDLEEFFSYPWGRVAFDMLMGSIKERDELALARDTIAVKGFVLAVQLVMVAAVPALTEVVQDTSSSSESDSEEVDGYAQDIFTKKKSLNPSHARNLDKRSDVVVTSILPQDAYKPLITADLARADEVHDSRVESMVKRLNSDYTFNNSSYGGGLRKLDIERMQQCVVSGRKSRKGKKIVYSGQDGKSGDITTLVLDKIKPQLEHIENSIKVSASRFGDVEANVVKQVEALFGKFRVEMITTVKELVSSHCKDHLSVCNEGTKMRTPTPHVVSGSASPRKTGGDENGMWIKDTLDNISAYSTPPRSTHEKENGNASPRSTNPAASGYIFETPVPRSNAQSATSENRGSEGRNRHVPNLEDGPSFSLGLTQEEHVVFDAPIQAVEVEGADRTDQMNVAENIDYGVVKRKSKRQKMVPTGLVEDYHCGAQLMSRRRESQRCIFVLEDMGAMARKYWTLLTKLESKLVINVSGLAVYGRDLRLIVERSRIYSAKVVDILIRVLRPKIMQQLPKHGPLSAQFLDSKFVPAITRNFPKFLKSKNKETYVFPKPLTDLFPTKESLMPSASRYYFPFNVGNKHWIGICFDAGRGMFTILDCCLSLNKDAAVEKLINPLAQMLPYLARFAGQPIGVDPVIECYDFARPKSVPQTSNPADSGLMSLLLMATHALFGIDSCKTITEEMLEDEGKRAAILAYEFHDKL